MLLLRMSTLLGPGVLEVMQLNVRNAISTGLIHHFSGLIDWLVMYSKVSYSSNDTLFILKWMTIDDHDGSSILKVCPILPA